MSTNAAEWQLDRLSAAAREAAEIAALSSGLSLSGWLRRMVADHCAADGIALPGETAKITEFVAREPRERSGFTPHPAASAPIPFKPVTPVAPPIRSAPAPLAGPPEPIPSFLAAPDPIAAPTPVAPPPTPVVAAPTPVVEVVAAPPLAEAPPVIEPVAAPPLDNPRQMVAVEALDPGTLGSRRGPDEAPSALIADIAKSGIAQPLIVRRQPGGERYEIIAGRRRWRAAQRIGLTQVPVTIRSASDGEAILASLAENLALGDLSPIEEAHAYLRLLTECGFDAGQITENAGSDRQHITRSLRLLGLPPLVRHLIDARQLSAAHALVLLDAPDPAKLADTILAERLTPEETRNRLPAAETTP